MPPFRPPLPPKPFWTKAFQTSLAIGKRILGANDEAWPRPYLHRSTQNGTQHRSVVRGEPTLRVHWTYLLFLMVAWGLFIWSFFVPSVNDSHSTLRGAEVFLVALKGCVLTSPGRLGCWIGTLANIMLLVATLTGLRRSSRARFSLLDKVLLCVGLSVWIIPLTFIGGYSNFYLGYGLWAIAHSLLGLRICFPSVIRYKHPPPEAAPKPRDDWPFEQTGTWDEGRG